MSQTNKFTIPIILTSLSVGVLSFLLPIYSKEMNMTVIEITWLFSLFSIINLLIKPIIGYFIDKIGRKKFLIIACITHSLSMFLYAYSNIPNILYYARILQAIENSIFLITTYSISIDISKDTNKGKNIGILQGASSKGALIGAIFGFSFLAYIPLSTGWNYLFIIYGILGIIASLYTIIFIPETIQKNKVDDITIKKFKLTKIYIILLIITLLCSITTSMLSPIFIIYLQENISKEIGYLAAAYIPASIIYSIFPKKAGKISDQYGRKLCMIIGLFISIITSILFVQISKGDLLIILWSIDAVGVVLFTISRKALISDITKNETIGKQYGIFTIFVSIGGSIGPILGGYLYETINSSIPFYLNSFILLLTAFILIIFIPKNLKNVNI